MVLLLLIFILSYLDRYIMSLLIEPIKETMGINDFQIGLLLGPAFTIFNVVVAVPLGLFADRTSRKWLLIFGIVIWCTMTSMSGFVMSFLPFLLLRFGLGLGEAVVSPCSISIISDYFGRRNRARAISLYMAGPYLGAGLAFLLGGYLVSVLERMGPMHIPGIRVFEPWQLTFLMVGIPGLLLAFLMLSVREPARTEKLGLHKEEKRVSAVRYMLKRWRGFGVIILGAACNFGMSALTFWTIPLFVRVYGWSVMQIGAVTGLFYFTAGPLGTVLAMWGTKMMGKGKGDSAMRVLIAGLFIAIPASILYPVMPNGWVAVAAMFLCFVGKAVATAGGPAALQMITPGEIRSRAVAIFNVLISLVGPLLGPPLIGLATDWAGSPKAIGMVLSGYMVIIGVPTLVVICLGLKHYRALAQGMAATLQAGKAAGQDGLQGASA